MSRRQPIITALRLLSGVADGGTTQNYLRALLTTLEKSGRTPSVVFPSRDPASAEDRRLEVHCAKGATNPEETWSANLLFGSRTPHADLEVRAIMDSAWSWWRWDIMPSALKDVAYSEHLFCLLIDNAVAHVVYPETKNLTRRLLGTPESIYVVSKLESLRLFERDPATPHDNGPTAMKLLEYMATILRNIASLPEINSNTRIISLQSGSEHIAFQNECDNRLQQAIFLPEAENLIEALGVSVSDWFEAAAIPPA